MKGTIHIQNVNEFVIAACYFSKNDVGHIYDQLQINGLLRHVDGDTLSGVERASTIFVDTGSANVTIDNCIFDNNQPREID